MPNGRRRGGGGGGGGRGGVTLELYLEGRRDDVRITVRLFEGQTAKQGEQVAFLLGTETNPYKEQLHIAGNPALVTIGPVGIGTMRVNLSDLGTEEYKTLTAQWGSRSSKPAHIPVDVELPSKSPKVKRLRVFPETETIDCPELKAVIDVYTLAADGKRPERGSFQVVSDVKFSIIDKGNHNTVLARNIKRRDLETSNEGTRVLEISFSELECRVTVRHKMTLEEVTKILKFV